MLFLIFYNICSVRMVDAHINMAKVSNNEVSICTGNPYKPTDPGFSQV